jgi:hypothetical protein
MTTGKHSELQTLQNSDGTFELVVSSEDSDDWSEVEDLRTADTSPKARAIPWKPLLAAVVGVLVVGFIGTKIVNSISGGVSIDEEPLEVVNGFRPYMGGASASLGTARTARPSAGARNVPAEDDWVDPETEERELVVEQGEPAIPTAQEQPQDEIVDEAQVEDVIPEPVNDAIHEMEPAAIPRGPNDMPNLQKNLNQQLRALSNDRIDMPFPRQNLGAALNGIGGVPDDEPAVEEGEDGDIPPSDENGEEIEE